MLTPYERYQHALATGEYLPDENQANVIDHLQKLYLHSEDTSWFKKKTPGVKNGLYIWGSVGVGKTWLMDIFFQSLTTKLKTRMHFHDFMREMQDQLQRLQGNADPLKKIAKQFARNTKVLCFDEFYVSDIGDAMILANLFEAFFKEKIIIVATSNVIPDNLYKDGLQRTRFLPAISLIKKNMAVLHLPTIRDYRLRELEEAGIFFSPLNTDTHHKVEKLFTQLAHGEIKDNKDIYLHDRPINTIKFTENIIWLDFKKLCSIPRSQMDYLSIVKRWSTVIIDNLKPISEKDINAAKYFINLIDILYDSRVTLILRSDCAIEDIYKSGDLSFEFKRTKSRLTEMQSTYYLQEAEEKLAKN